MAELRPYPFGALITRMFRELHQQGAIFDLPARKFYTGDADRDFAVRFQGHVASSPLGPAAGPQSQMAQNIVLSWLAGCRIFELKTVQILDELAIPRPCIDMQTVGYNVEWSQELKLEQSLEEYVKGSMLLEILAASGEVALAPGFDQLVLDMSVGYDLKGIQTDRVQAFMRGMMDASAVVEQLRAQIPEEFARYRDLDFRTRLSDTLTLSTFHGCPPDEIESIIAWLIDELGLHCIVKLNPTLLGPDRVAELVRERLGYTELSTPGPAFDKDTKWEQAVGFVERLGAKAAARGLGFGVKFSNTLIVENHREFFPAREKEMYLSGAPLHVLAMNLVGQFRQRFGDRYPISFSAGVDNRNFPDAVATGLTPITVCSDLLKPGGYGRAQAYFKELTRRMDEVGARDIEGFIVGAYGKASEALGTLVLDDGLRTRCNAALRGDGDVRALLDGDQWAALVSAAKVLNTDHYVATATQDPRYGRGATDKPPKKVGTSLVLFDCLTCDKCLPVCPNDANFRFVLPRGEVEVVTLTREGDGWSVRRGLPVKIGKKHQIGNFADFCNECGNCDVFCPEDGGPYIAKPRFFGTAADWAELKTHDGFHIEVEGERRTVRGRFEQREFTATFDGGHVAYSGGDFAIEYDAEDPAGSASGTSDGDVDLTYAVIMDIVSRSVLAAPGNYIAPLRECAHPGPQGLGLDFGVAPDGG